MIHKLLLFVLLTFGCAYVHAQRFSVSPSIGISRSFATINNINAISLGKLKNGEIRNGLGIGMSLQYRVANNTYLVCGYNALENGYGWRITPTNGGRFTSVGGFVGTRFNQFFLGYSKSLDLLFENKTDKQEKKAGWVYDDKEKWLRAKIGAGIALNTMNTPVENLKNHFLPLPATNNDNPEFVWMLGYETPRYVHKTSMGIWFRTGLTFVKKGRDKLSLDFVMNIGLQDKYIIETNNKYGNTRTGQLLKEEQFNVVSKGTSMALMLSYPIYFGKRK